MTITLDQTSTICHIDYSYIYLASFQQRNFSRCHSDHAIPFAEACLGQGLLIPLRIKTRFSTWVDGRTDFILFQYSQLYLIALSPFSFQQQWPFLNFLNAPSFHRTLVHQVICIWYIFCLVKSILSSRGSYSIINFFASLIPAIGLIILYIHVHWSFCICLLLLFTVIKSVSSMVFSVAA